MIDPAKKFWKWFEANNDAYLFLKEVDPDEKSRLMSLFLSELHAYCDQLYYDIIGHSEGPHEVMITAAGQKEYFGHVERLIAQAPKLKNWKFIAFSPGRTEHFKITTDNIVLKTEDIWVMPFEYPADLSLIGMQICLKDYELLKDEEHIMQTIYKILDLIIGERSFALDIDYVEIGPVPEGDPEEEGIIEIVRLPDYIESRKKRYPRKN